MTVATTTDKTPTPASVEFGHHDLPIPGTYMFDGEAAMKGYNLNKMCFSFNNAENRAEFLKDEDAYCRKYGLTDEQRKAILERNVLAMIHNGRMHLLPGEIRRNFRPDRAGRGRPADAA